MSLLYLLNALKVIQEANPGDVGLDTPIILQAGVPFREFSATPKSVPQIHHLSSSHPNYLAPPRIDADNRANSTVQPELAMQIRFQCPSCFVKLGIATRKAGEVVTCPKCCVLVKVPSLLEGIPLPIPTSTEPSGGNDLIESGEPVAKSDPTRFLPLVRKR